MYRAARVAVVVPAFNEERLIAKTLVSVPPFVDDVVVVDDASTDHTSARAEAVRDPRVRVVRHEANRGVGAAIATGYERAIALGAEIVVVMAGDAQMDPRDLAPLIDPIARDEADYTKGDRLSYPDARARMPLSRWLGNLALAALTRLATGLSVRDSQCGYTAISARALPAIELERLWPRYGYPNDLLGRVSAARLRVREVIVRPVYADETSGIGLRHAVIVVPYVLARVALRRLRSSLRFAPRLERFAS